MLRAPQDPLGRNLDAVAGPSGAGQNPGPSPRVLATTLTTGPQQSVLGLSLAWKTGSV